MLFNGVAINLEHVLYIERDYAFGKNGDKRDKKDGYASLEFHFLYGTKKDVHYKSEHEKLEAEFLTGSQILLKREIS